MPITIGLDHKPAGHSQAARDQGVEQDGCRHAVGRERGAGIETEPSEPQQSRAEQHERQIVRAHRVVAESQAGPQDEGECQRRGTRGHLHHQTAREVERPELGDPAAGTPDPVRHRRIDQ